MVHAQQQGEAGQSRARETAIGLAGASQSAGAAAPQRLQDGATASAAAATSEAGGGPQQDEGPTRLLTPPHGAVAWLMDSICMRC